MLLPSTVAIFLFICVFTLYFTWGFTKLSGFHLIFVDARLYAKQIIISIVYLLSTFAIDYLIPESYKKYTFVSIYLSFGILPLLAIKNINIRKETLGNLLFRSQSLSKTIYFVIPLILVALWGFHRVWQNLSIQTIFSTTNIGGMEINSYLWLTCSLVFFVSIAIYSCVFSYNKLEIRDRGIWYISEIAWENMTDYYWIKNQQSDLLVIKHINGYKNEIVSKYPIAPGEKERIGEIFQDKINND